MPKKILLGAILILFFALLLPGLSRVKPETPATLSIITTNFPTYDFARAVTKGVEDVDLKMLISPGTETHDFEPTPKDLIDIETSDLFIYTGGENDAWVENLLKNLDPEKTKTLKLLDLVDTKKEETVEGMEPETTENTDEPNNAKDEHVWTSLKNAEKIIEKIKEEIIKLDSKNAEKYEQNTKNYVKDLSALDENFENLVKTASRKELIFGDRFPFRYFVDDYGLTYYAAFPGCSEQTEASSKTLAFLIDKVKSDNIPVVFHIELSNKKIAEEIARETGAKVLEFHSAHNISKEDFAAGRTYLDIMKSNYENLKEALK